MVCKMDLFVNNLSIPCSRYVISNLFLTLSLVTKEYHLEHFTLKYPAVIEIAGWDYYYSSQEGQENNSSTGTVHDFRKRFYTSMWGNIIILNET